MNENKSTEKEIAFRNTYLMCQRVREPLTHDDYSAYVETVKDNVNHTGYTDSVTRTNSPKRSNNAPPNGPNLLKEVLEKKT